MDEYFIWQNTIDVALFTGITRFSITLNFINNMFYYSQHFCYVSNQVQRRNTNDDIKIDEDTN